MVITRYDKLQTMGRPKNEEDKITVELQLPAKLVGYLDELKEKQGFGETRQEIIKNFAWDRINQLILEKRLKEK
jgi:hypothetical protein